MAVANIAEYRSQQRHRLFRDILEVARIYQTEMMRLLEEDKGHSKLRLSFQPIMSNIPPEGIRITELAAGLGMSKQNCSQLVNQVAAAGYIRRGDDAQDKRARRILLTPRGLQLIVDGIEVTERVDRQCKQLLGESEFQRLARTLSGLCRALHLKPLVRMDAHSGVKPLPNTLSNQLIQLAHHCNQSLMELTMVRGHPSLRPAYGQVLIHIGSSGARIQEIARINNISKQAVGQLVSELENLGYLRRTRDPADGRGKILFFTEDGKRLLGDSIAAADELRRLYQEALSKQQFTALERSLGQLYTGLVGATEHTEFGQSEATADAENSLSTEQLLLYLLYRLKLGAPFNGKFPTEPSLAAFTLGRAELDMLENSTLRPELAESRLEALLGEEKLGALHTTLEQLAKHMPTPQDRDGVALQTTGESGGEV